MLIHQATAYYLPNECDAFNTQTATVKVGSGEYTRTSQAS